ncbi:MAG: polysaccharide export protein [Candidatus Omnitrophica bacterium]|nr:polysaccharide export protein [Candidatus Omnitrophota bacterium]
MKAFINIIVIAALIASASYSYAESKHRGTEGEDAPIYDSVPVDDRAAPPGSPQAKAKMLYDEGNELYGQGKYGEAEKRFQMALDLVGGGKGEETAKKKKTAAKKQEYNFWKWNRKVSTAKAEFVPRGYSAEYLLGAGDGLHVFVWQNPDLSGNVTVQPDGRISFPLVGSVMAKGLTTMQLGKEIAKRLEEYVKNPQVSVSIKRMGSKKVIVLGEVKWPGVYTLSGATTVLEAVAMAQGFTDSSLASTIVILKGVYSGDPRVIRVSANLALRGFPEHNIVLESEDVVFVPKKPLSDANWLADEIMNPLQKGVLLGDSLHSRRW